MEKHSGSQVVNISDRERARHCPYCANGRVIPSYKDEVYEHHQDESPPLKIEAKHVPVGICDRCGEIFVDKTTFMVRHDYVCEAMGLLKPSQIKAIRERHQLSQIEFAEITGFGEATISRWERGRLIQNRSADAFLQSIIRNPHLISELKENVVQIRKSKEKANTNGSRSRFRALSDPEITKQKQRSKRFALVA